MAWRRIGGKPFSEAMLDRSIDAYMRHYGEMGLSDYVEWSLLQWVYNDVYIHCCALYTV